MKANAIFGNKVLNFNTNLMMFLTRFSDSPPFSNPISVRFRTRNPVCRRGLSGATRSRSSVTEVATVKVEDEEGLASKLEAEQEKDASKSVARRLILLRHAQSSWENSSLRDHDRPLSKEGRADAAKLSQKLYQLGWIPQLILSSDAVRTRETLKIMQENVPSLLDSEVRFISSFYSIAAMDGQTAEHLQQYICKYSTDEIVTVMCMGHNRGWEEAASAFTGSAVELKTCNAALLEAIGKSWEEAFVVAGLGGWKLLGIVKPSNDL
ncbi:hypothetical protein K2173_009069 [Erythroxylum novogranatense]|uniref:Phosphoglycerate mutase family protein n=1 Tax=Erythroxylum novogranatense TaxID=1862640 RepID=A0AAV8TSK9_9ROSI|nr:hypothetical protein K2173_009069 [Erythroxylum novogranatense]